MFFQNSAPNCKKVVYMKNLKKFIPAILLVAVLVLSAVLVMKLLSGAVTIVTGAFNAVLGIGVLLALVLIVLWMFYYAKKHK